MSATWELSVMTDVNRSIAPGAKQSSSTVSAGEKRSALNSASPLLTLRMVPTGRQKSFIFARLSAVTSSWYD